MSNNVRILIVVTLAVSVGMVVIAKRHTGSQDQSDLTEKVEMPAKGTAPGGGIS